ncbi:MAG: YqgE/AlgH family protein [Sphingobacteriales bacterium]|nr:MAG: YqgE/AlgH family protein [Sphingobacteriales bacterium]
MISEKLHKGLLLIAEPSIIGDLSFNRSVILLADHNVEGSVGFILNKPLKYTVGDLVPDIEANFKIYNGGPVEQDNLYFIHNIPDLIPNSIEISSGIYWGGDFDQIKDLITNYQLTEDEIKFFTGYSGWTPTQLDEELREDSWIVANNFEADSIFSNNEQNLWREVVIGLGQRYAHIANFPENPMLN